MKILRTADDVLFELTSQLSFVRFEIETFLKRNDELEAEVARLTELSNPLLFLQGYEMACRDRDRVGVAYVDYLSDKSRAAVLAEREACIELIGGASCWDRDDLIAAIRGRPAP